MYNIGDFRNFCLDSCCRNKYKFRLNPFINTNYGPQWLIEGFILTDDKKYFLVAKDFRTEFYKSVIYDNYIKNTFINSVEEVKKVLEGWSRK